MPHAVSAIPASLREVRDFPAKAVLTALRGLSVSADNEVRRDPQDVSGALILEATGPGGLIDQDAFAVEGYMNVRHASRCVEQPLSQRPQFDRVHSFIAGLKRLENGPFFLASDAPAPQGDRHRSQRIGKVHLFQRPHRPTGYGRRVRPSGSALVKQFRLQALIEKGNAEAAPAQAHPHKQARQPCADDRNSWSVCHEFKPKLELFSNARTRTAARQAIAPTKR